MFKKLITLIAIAVVKEINAYNLSNKEIALKYIQSYLGVQYFWGGDDPMIGFDCSGLVVEYLKAGGILQNGQDFTAAQLYEMFLCVNEPKRGDLVFYYNNTDKIGHVEIMLNSEQSIGSSGGNQQTVSQKKAIEQNAYVKIHNIYHRKGIAGFRRPFIN